MLFSTFCKLVWTGVDSFRLVIKPLTALILLNLNKTRTQDYSLSQTWTKLYLKQFKALVNIQGEWKAVQQPIPNTFYLPYVHFCRINHHEHKVSSATSVESITKADRYPNYHHITLKVNWNGLSCISSMSWKKFIRQDTITLFGTGKLENVFLN